MTKLSIAVFGLAIGLAMPLVVAPAPTHAAAIELAIGASLNHGHAITCGQGQRLLENRGFRNVRRVDCRERVYVYHETQRGSRFEVALNSHTGRVADLRRIR